jgi:hypothetical protein
MNYSYIKTVFPTFENTNSFNSKMFNELNSHIPNKKTFNVNGVNNETTNVSKLNDTTDKFYLTESVLPGTVDVISESTKIPTGNTVLPIGGDSPSTINSIRAVTPMVKSGIPIDKDNLHYYLGNYKSDPGIRSPVFQGNQGLNNKTISFENFNSIPQSQSQSTQPPTTPSPANVYTDPGTLQTPTPTPTPTLVREKESSGLSDVCSASYQHIMQCAQCKEMLYKNFNYEHKKNNYNEEIFELVSYCIFAMFILLLLEKLHK